MADPLEKLVVAREKNFIKENILRAKRSYPAEPKQRSVDTRRGDTHDLKRSGLLPIYVYKKVRVLHAKGSLLFALLAFCIIFRCSRRLFLALIDAILKKSHLHVFTN